MNLRRCCSTNQQRNCKSFALHFFCNMNHFIQRRCNQSTQPDHINILTTGGFKNFLSRYHYTKVNDIIVIASQYYSYNIFTNIMYIAFHRCHENFPFPFCRTTVSGKYGSIFFSFQVRFKIGNSLLHHPCAFYNLRKKHFSRAKKISDNIHSIHQGPFDQLKSDRVILPGIFKILFDKICDSTNQCMTQPFFRTSFSPLFIFLFFLSYGSFQGFSIGD